MRLVSRWVLVVPLAATPLLGGCRGDSALLQVGQEGSGRVITVVISDDVPSAAARAVTAFQTDQGLYAARNEAVRAGTDPSPEGGILGLNDRGEVMLASFSPDASTSLSVRSTAIALVRMALGEDGANPGSQARLDRKIQAAPGYAQLEQEVDRALAMGVAPDSLASVRSGVVLVTRQMRATLVAQATPSS